MSRRSLTRRKLVGFHRWLFLRLALLAFLSWNLELAVILFIVVVHDKSRAIAAWLTSWPRGTDPARVNYVDVVLGFSMLVAFMAVAPWLYSGIAMATGVVDPFSRVLLELTLPIFVVAMIVSIGVSGRSR